MMLTAAPTPATENVNPVLAATALAAGRAMLYDVLPVRKVMFPAKIKGGVKVSKGRRSIVDMKGNSPDFGFSRLRTSRRIPVTPAGVRFADRGLFNDT
jgi:hypothetical protein